jgi:hypothetical protein
LALLSVILTDSLDFSGERSKVFSVMCYRGFLHKTNTGKTPIQTVVILCRRKGGGTMITKRDLAIFILALCSIATLLMVKPVLSPPPYPYDPWSDLNDDGHITYLDLGELLSHYGGTAELSDWNKTAFLLQLNVTYPELLARLDSLNNTNIELQSRVDNLTASLMETQTKLDNLNATLTQQISDVEAELDVLNATKLGKPYFDSGWTEVILGDTLVPHTCNTTNVIVYMIGKQTGGTAHQKDYGGWQRSDSTWYGAYWYDLTETHIRVHRHGNDGDWQWVRVFMWKIPQS